MWRWRRGKRKWKIQKFPFLFEKPIFFCNCSNNQKNAEKPTTTNVNFLKLEGDFFFAPFPRKFILMPSAVVRSINFKMRSEKWNGKFLLIFLISGLRFSYAKTPLLCLWYYIDPTKNSSVQHNIEYELILNSKNHWKEEIQCEKIRFFSHQILSKKWRKFLIT